VGEHTERLGVQIVQHQEFDVVAFETLSNVKEAQAICHLLRTEPTGKPAWLSFSCKDGASLSHGENFARDAVPLALEVIFFLSVSTTESSILRIRPWPAVMCRQTVCERSISY